MFITGFSFLLKIFFRQKSEGESGPNSFLSILIGVYSPANLFYLRNKHGDSEIIVKYKRKSNFFLSCFYISFTITILYGIFYAATHEGRVY